MPPARPRWDCRTQRTLAISCHKCRRGAACHARVNPKPYRCAARRCASPTSSPDALLLRITQIAIAATDLAEIIGSAIALYLLFGLPVWAGVLITGLVSVPKP